MAFWSWSKTAGNNATADSSINWAEGQSPSSINDSARAMMARTAEWRDDISGTVTTGGTSTAYTVTSNQVFDTLAHMNGAMIAFVPHTTNGAIVTLNVDGLGAKPLRSSPGVDIGAGVIVQGTPYVATYNNVDQVFYLQGFFGNPFNIPIAGLMFYIGATPPNANFAFPVGQAIARITYAPLYSLVGNTYGGGDGSTTFNLPDLRGMVIAGLDGMGGSGITTRISIAGGNFDATVLGASGGSQSRTILNGHLPASIPYSDPGHGHPGSTVGLAQNNSVTSGSANAVQVTGSSNLSINPATIGITINPGGANTPLPILQPTMVLPYILRII